MLGDGQYGIYDRQLAQDIARYFRQLQRVGIGRGNMYPHGLLPFKAKADGIKQGHIVEFVELVADFEARTSDEEIAYFKNFAMQKARHPDSDADFTNLRRNTWGVSLSDVDADDCGIAVVTGPACVEAVIGTATATNVGNFIVPWTSKDKAGKVEVRPYGIARCIEQEPELEGWRWVMMGDCKWDFLGKTTTAHGKGDTETVNVYFGSDDLGSETASGLTQETYNRWADIDSGKWVYGRVGYLGAELVNGEC